VIRAAIRGKRRVRFRIGLRAVSRMLILLRIRTKTATPGRALRTRTFSLLLSTAKRCEV
jgi:hypothetical protein